MTMTVADDPELLALRRKARTSGIVTFSMFVLGIAVFWTGIVMNQNPFWVLFPIAITQCIFGIRGVVFGIKAMRRAAVTPAGSVAAVMAYGVFALLGIVGIPVFFVAGALFHSGLGIAGWGRPLRVRGKMVHPKIRVGDEWTAGEPPDVSALDGATRAALAAWWLQDAKKEHASVPAFSKISWQLAALGAPADLLMRCHVAALEEVDHTRRCFALVAAYAGRSSTVEAMPELNAAWVAPADPLVAMALDSLVDGCLTEDLNADAAGLALSRAQDPAVRGVVERITRDERAHAELAWDILGWCLRTGGAKVASAVRRELERLPARGPVPYDDSIGALVANADAAQLLAHGRVPTEDWPGLYQRRRAMTIARVRSLIDAPLAAAA
jgi:hypothetical protein